MVPKFFSIVWVFGGVVRNKTISFSMETFTACVIMTDIFGCED